MSKQGWIAIFLAIIFPTTALIVIMLARPSGKDQPSPSGHCPSGPGFHHGPKMGHHGPSHHGPKMGHHGPGHHGPKMGHHGGPNSGNHGPDGATGKEGHLKMMARDLDLTKEQIEKIIDVESKTGAMREKLRLELDKKHQELSELMKNGEADDAKALKIIDELVKMKSEMDRSHLTMPFEIRKILTPEQRKKMEKILSDRHGPAIPHKGGNGHPFPAGGPHGGYGGPGPMMHGGHGGPHGGYGGPGPMMHGGHGGPHGRFGGPGGPMMAMAPL